MAKARVEQLARPLRVALAPHGAGASVTHFGLIDILMVCRGIGQDPLAERFRSTPASNRTHVPRSDHYTSTPAIKMR
jgi:hypothetical protein